MKGGRTAPRNTSQAQTICPTSFSFNEGGADCPPKPLIGSINSHRAQSFNEGGADCPPKQS